MILLLKKFAHFYINTTLPTLCAYLLPRAVVLNFFRQHLLRNCSLLQTPLTLNKL